MPSPQWLPGLKDKPSQGQEELLEGCNCFVPVVSRNVCDLLWSQHFMGDGARQNFKGQLGDNLVLELYWLTIYNPLHL